MTDHNLNGQDRRRIILPGEDVVPAEQAVAAVEAGKLATEEAVREAQFWASVAAALLDRMGETQVVLTADDVDPDRYAVAEELGAVVEGIARVRVSVEESDASTRD